MTENTGPTFMDIDYVVAWTTTDLTTVAVDSKKTIWAVREPDLEQSRLITEILID